MSYKKISACLISLSFISSLVMFSSSKTEAQTANNIKKCINNLMYDTNFCGNRVRTDLSSEAAAQACL